MLDTSQWSLALRCVRQDRASSPAPSCSRVSHWKSIKCDKEPCEVIHHLDDHDGKTNLQFEAEILGWTVQDGIGDVCPGCSETMQLEQEETE